MAKSNASSKKNVHAYLCNTPKNECTGATNSNGGEHKVHRTREEAYKCYVRYLKRLGYTQLKPTQFQSPEGVNDGRVLLVSKRSKYGLRMKGEGPKGKGRFVRHKHEECLIG